jgi:hypothetical protein
VKSRAAAAKATSDVYANASKPLAAAVAAVAAVCIETGASEVSVAASVVDTIMEGVGVGTAADFAMANFVALDCVVLVCIVRDCIVLDCIVRDCIVLDCIVLDCIVLDCVVLDCIVRNCAVLVLDLLSSLTFFVLALAFSVTHFTTSSLCRMK